MDRFHVLVCFPTDNKVDNTVTITGKEEKIKVAKKCILEVAEEYMQEVIEREKEKEFYNLYSRWASPESRGGRYHLQLKDFIVSDTLYKHGAPHHKHA